MLVNPLDVLKHRSALFTSQQSGHSHLRRAHQILSGPYSSSTTSQRFIALITTPTQLQNMALSLPPQETNDTAAHSQSAAYQHPIPRIKCSLCGASLSPLPLHPSNFPLRARVGRAHRYRAGGIMECPRGSYVLPRQVRRMLVTGVASGWGQAAGV